MLVLSRKVDESIMIGDDVELVIVAVRGDKVRLGITAPKSIAVHRTSIVCPVHQGTCPNELFSQWRFDTVDRH